MNSDIAPGSVLHELATDAQPETMPDDRDRPSRRLRVRRTGQAQMLVFESAPPRDGHNLDWAKGGRTVASTRPGSLYYT